MSNIDPVLPDPGPGKGPPPDLVPPLDDPAENHVDDDVREPGEEAPPIGPDPEEGGGRRPDIRQKQALRKVERISI